MYEKLYTALYDVMLLAVLAACSQTLATAPTDKQSTLIQVVNHNEQQIDMLELQTAQQLQAVSTQMAQRLKTGILCRLS